MNIRSRMLKVANNLMEDLVKSFEMTEEEWKKYSELHPNAKRENHQIVPDRKNQNGNGRKKENVVRKKYRLFGGRNNEFFDRKIDLSKEDPKILSENQKILRHKANYEYDWSDLRRVAMDQYTPVDVLEKLSNHYDERVRGGVARNPQTPKNILEKLSKDKSESVRIGVARNIVTGGNILKNLLQDESPNVRIVVYFNPNATQEMIDRIEKDKEVEELYNEKTRNRQMFHI